MNLGLLLARSARPLGEALPELFGRLHPVSVHFPVALLLVAAFCEALNALRPSDTLRRGAVLCLVFGTLGAALAAGTGWVHVELEGSRKDGVELHRWLGVATASLALVTTVLGLTAMRGSHGSSTTAAYRLALLFTAGLVGFTGKIGGEMSWGKDWYTRPFEARDEPRTLPDIVLGAQDGDAAGTTDDAPTDGRRTDETPSGGTPTDASPSGDTASGDSAPDDSATQDLVADAVSYAREIAPLLDARCYECHGPTGKADADLRLSDLVEAQEVYFGFDWEALLVPGSPDDSALFAVMALPDDHDLAMPPPADAERMTDDEIELVRRWIEEGASLEEMLAD